MCTFTAPGHLVCVCRRGTIHDQDPRICHSAPSLVGTSARPPWVHPGRSMLDHAHAADPAASRGVTRALSATARTAVSTKRARTARTLVELRARPVIKAHSCTDMAIMARSVQEWLLMAGPALVLRGLLGYGLVRFWDSPQHGNVTVRGAEGSHCPLRAKDLPPPRGLSQAPTINSRSLTWWRPAATRNEEQAHRRAWCH